MSRRSAPHARGALVIAASLMIGVSCSDDRIESRADEVHLMLLGEPAWELTEAVDYQAGLGALEARNPDLDWFAEYDGPRVDNSDGSYTVPHVSTFGHTAGLEQRRDQLPGFELRSEVVDGHQALVAVATDGNPAIVIIEVATDYTTTLLTYDVGVDLTELAARLVAVDEQQWTAAGGSLLDCVPFEAGCAGHD